MIQSFMDLNTTSTFSTLHFRNLNVIEKGKWRILLFDDGRSWVHWRNNHRGNVNEPTYKLKRELFVHCCSFGGCPKKFIKLLNIFWLNIYHLKNWSQFREQTHKGMEEFEEVCSEEELRRRGGRMCAEVEGRAIVIFYMPFAAAFHSSSRKVHSALSSFRTFSSEVSNEPSVHAMDYRCYRIYLFITSSHPPSHLLLLHLFSSLI